jgi:hypothetical protein
VILGAVGVIGLDAGFTAAKAAGVAVIGAYALVANRRAGLSIFRSIVVPCVSGRAPRRTRAAQHEFH